MGSGGDPPQKRKKKKKKFKKEKEEEIMHVEENLPDESLLKEDEADSSQIPPTENKSKKKKKKKSKPMPEVVDDGGDGDGGETKEHNDGGQEKKSQIKGKDRKKKLDNVEEKKSDENLIVESQKDNLNCGDSLDKSLSNKKKKKRKRSEEMECVNTSSLEVGDTPVKKKSKKNKSQQDNFFCEAFTDIPEKISSAVDDDSCLDISQEGSVKNLKKKSKKSKSPHFLGDTTANQEKDSLSLNKNCNAKPKLKMEKIEIVTYKQKGQENPPYVPMKESMDISESSSHMDVSESSSANEMPNIAAGDVNLSPPKIENSGGGIFSTPSNLTNALAMKASALFRKVSFSFFITKNNIFILCI